MCTHLAAKPAADALGVDDDLVHWDAQHAVDCHLVLRRALHSAPTRRSAASRYFQCLPAKYFQCWPRDLTMSQLTH